MIRCVVVGIDGSAGSFAALDWAVRLVGPGGVVHAVRVVEPGHARPAADVDGPRHTIEPPDVEITRRVVEGHEVDELLEIASVEGADLIVVGVHRQLLPAPRVIGHVTAGLLERADRPVAIVRDGAESAAVNGDTVVAGVGHGPATRVALEWAVRFADAHGTALSLVHGLVHRPVFSENGLLDVIAYYIDPYKIGEWALEDLEDLADEIQRSTDADVPITWTTRGGLAGPSLVEASAGAALLVIGRHRGADGDGRHGPTPSLHHALTHAPCPVVIVPVVEPPADR